MKLFRGFVPIKKKKAVMKFKGVEELLTLEQAKELYEFAGILAHDVVLIDVDDERQSEILIDIVEELQLDCYVIQTTRGRHFYFSNLDEHGQPIIGNCGTSKRLACGLFADIKSGVKNSYAVLKKDGKERFLEWEPSGDQCQVVPAFLRPVAGGPDFQSLHAGSGRNNALFSYILTLQSEGFSVDECKQTLNVINHHVLPEPLPNDELDTITRDDAFQKDLFFVKNKFLFDKFANFIMTRHHIVKVHGQLHIFNDGVYSNEQRLIESVMVSYIKNLKDSDRNEVLKYLKIIAPERHNFADARFIAFNNGILDIVTGQIRDFTPDLLLTNKIPWNYIPNAYNCTMDATLDKISCKDPEIRSLLEECVGYCFYRRNELGKSFILIGEGSNGKSVFLDCLKNVLGVQNISSLDISELGSRFSTASLFGRLANIGDDIGNDFLHGGTVATFKKIVTGSRIKAERKGQDPFEFDPYCKMLFSANEIPRMRDKSTGLMRRLIIIPFNAVFSKNDPDFDPFIQYKLRDQESIEYLIALGVEGLKRVLVNQSFTESVDVQEQVKQYEQENNPILLFLEDCEEHEILNQSTKEVYSNYNGFCLANNLAPMASSVFTREICKRTGYVIERKRVDGERVRIYKKD